MTLLAAPPAPSPAVARRSGPARAAWLLVVLVALAGLMAASVAIGSRGVGWSEIVAALGGSTETIGEAAVAKRVRAARGAPRQRARPSAGSPGGPDLCGAVVPWGGTR